MESKLSKGEVRTGGASTVKKQKSLDARDEELWTRGHDKTETVVGD